ncbi:MAG: bifunctional riboflavin kinase/FAD synthetase [Lachnospiraceae bacterium]
MQYIKGIESYKETHQTAITLGKFDGLHRGHQKLVDRVKSYADHNTKSVVFAFDMQVYFKQRGIKKQYIMTNVERYLKLEKQVDYLIECPFTENIHNMKAEDFISEVLVKKFHVAYVVVGTDYHFGHGKKGDVQMLAHYAKIYGYQLDVIEKETHEGKIISSSYIKREIIQGDFELVNVLLGYPYSIRGTVEHGRKLGRKLGYPTMNITPKNEKLLPPNGVYDCRVLIDGKYFDGIGNLGCKPTIAQKMKILMEVFLFDFREDAYGKRIEIQFLRFERAEIKFASIQELGQRMEQDVLCGKNFFEDLQ